MKFLKTWFALALTIFAASPALGITFEFSWEGDAGYRVEGVFSYDQTTAPAVIEENGLGPTDDLESLTVEFFDPAGVSFQVSDNVVAGTSNYSFLTFQFDTLSEQFIGFLDVGKDDGIDGDTWLTFNEPTGDCDLTQVGAANPIDSSTECTITAQQVVVKPVVVPTLTYFGLAILVLLVTVLAVWRVRVHV